MILISLHSEIALFDLFCFIFTFIGGLFEAFEFDPIKILLLIIYCSSKKLIVIKGFFKDFLISFLILFGKLPKIGFLLFTILVLFLANFLLPVFALFKVAETSFLTPSRFLNLLNGNLEIGLSFTISRRAQANALPTSSRISIL